MKPEPKSMISGWIKGAFRGGKKEMQESIHQKLDFILSTAPIWDRCVAIYAVKFDVYIVCIFLYLCMYCQILVDNIKSMPKTSYLPGCWSLPLLLMHDRNFILITQNSCDGADRDKTKDELVISKLNRC